MSDQDQECSELVPAASEFTPPTLVDPELIELLATRGVKEARRWRYRAVIIGISLGFGTVLTPYQLHLPIVTLIGVAIAIGWFVGWLKARVVADAWEKRRYDELTRELPAAIRWNLYLSPISYYQIQACTLAQINLLVLEGRNVELEALSRYAWAYNEKVARTTGVPNHLAIANNLAVSYMLQARYDEAAKLWTSILEKSKSGKMRSLLLNNLAYCLIKDKKLSEAEKFLADALQLNGPNFNTVQGMRLQIITALVLMEKKEFDGAEIAINHSRATAIKLKQPLDYQATYDAMLAEIRHTQNRLDESELYYKNAVDIMESADNPDYIVLAKCCRKYAELLVQTNKPEAAREQVARARHFYDFYLKREMDTVELIRERLANPKTMLVGTELLERSSRVKSIEMLHT